MDGLGDAGDLLAISAHAADSFGDGLIARAGYFCGGASLSGYPRSLVGGLEARS